MNSTPRGWFLGYLNRLTSDNIFVFVGVRVAPTLELFAFFVRFLILGAAAVVEITDLIAVKNRLFEHGINLIVNKAAPS